MTPRGVYCDGPRGVACRGRAQAARRGRRWSREFRAGCIDAERRIRAEARRRGLCAQCGRETRYGPPLAHLTFEECGRRFPALVTALAWVLCGSESEAACCIRDARDRMPCGAEVVSHSGLTPMDRVLHARRAWRDSGLRAMLRQNYHPRRAARRRSTCEV